jgi:hypothetical protein
VFVILLLPAIGFCQRFKVVELKPIVNQGFSYYYDGKKVHGGAYGLQVPLLSLNDEEVNRKYQAFQIWEMVGSLTAIFPAVYLVSITQKQYVNQNEFWIVFGGSLAAAFGCQLISHFKIKQGIERYNTLILSPSSQVLGPSLTYRF